MTKPIIIAGPCSAESRKQLGAAAAGVGEVDFFRAGIWKPRTRPGSFEGIGRRGLSWLAEIREKYALPCCTEVATPKHVEQVLKAGLDGIWIGARTTANPFMVHDICSAFKGCENLHVFIKNPVNPDLPLWMGAIERTQRAGIRHIYAVHRGFSHFQASIYRNAPLWFIPIDLKVHMPEIPLICDPSHMGGQSEYVRELSLKALSLGYDGLMVEVHPNPEKALSDAAQQLTPAAFRDMRASLAASDLFYRRCAETGNRAEKDAQIENLRLQIDLVDEEIIEALGRRFSLVEKIGREKLEKGIGFLQIRRWQDVIARLQQLAVKQGIDPAFIEKLYQQIHYESLICQQKVLTHPDE